MKCLKLQWDRVVTATCVFAGVIAGLAGYVGVSGTSVTSEQIPYVVSGGMLGLFLFGLGAVIWLPTDVRDERRKLDPIYRSLYLAGAIDPNELPPVEVASLYCQSVGGGSEVVQSAERTAR